MKIVTTTELKALIEKQPNYGIVFCEYEPDVYNSELMVTEGGKLFATNVVPWHGEPYCWDWSIGDYADDDLFAVFDHEDILQMIQTLTRGLRLELVCDGGKLNLSDYEGGIT